MGLRNVGWRPGVAEEASRGPRRRRTAKWVRRGGWGEQTEVGGAGEGSEEGRRWAPGGPGGAAWRAGRAGPWEEAPGSSRGGRSSRAGPGRAREGRPGARRHFRECLGCGRRLVVLSAAGRAAEPGERAARPSPPVPVRAARPLPAPWGRPRGYCAQ